VKHPQEELMYNGKSLNALTKLIIDSRGLLWFVNDHWENVGVFCYDPKTDQIVNSFRQFNNQDGTTYNDYRPHCIVEDLEGNLWLGTKYGPFMLEKENVLTKDTYLTQVKVPRNDGTNYADYLLSGANISCIAIDGGNRKWFGTYGAGVYLISADNMTQLQHFTTENSPLLSDNIEAITINPSTGEVFFGTENGLCSYMGDATQAQVSMVKDNVYAYPNPVVKDYDGLITVVGLSFNADVKIITTNGQLVAEGRSNGGTFTWNGRDRQGRRVASGIYMVVTATSDGSKGTVCKIAVIN
jgi:ligand-binding sensor domain-containing protein